LKKNLAEQYSSEPQPADIYCGGKIFATFILPNE